MGIRNVGLLAVALAVSTSAFGMPMITVDGLVSDWGVTVADGVTGNEIGSDFSGLGAIVHHAEDTDDTRNNYNVGPNSGGQNFDAELLASLIEDEILYILIVSGQRPDNGAKYFEPGDIRITTEAGVYGIEVGGGVGGGVGTAVVAGDPGSTYTLDNNGNAIGHTGHTSGQVAGSIWENPDWFLDPIAPSGPTQMVTIGTTVYKGSVDSYHFTRNEVTAQHSIIELAVDLSNLGSPSNFIGIDWRPSCGNDELMILSDPATLQVPEPYTLALVGLGLAGMGVVRRRKRS